MKYSVCLLDERGNASYLSVKGRTEWKTKRIARQHRDDVRTLIAKGRFARGVVTADLETEFGEVLICD